MNLDIPQQWRMTLAGLFLGLAGLLVALQDSLLSLWTLWNNSDSYGHGVFVIPLALYSLWLLRGELAELSPRPAAFGFVLLVPGVALWIVAQVGEVMVAHQLALVGLLAVTVIGFVGWAVAARLWFPLLFPFLAVPVWDVLVPALQEHTAVVTATAMRYAGVPVYLEGYFIAIPSGNFEIAEVCAGLRYLMAMASIATFYAFLNNLSIWSGFAFVGLALVWSIFFNWVRVSCIVLIGHITEMQSELVHDHYTFGWILFAVALVPLFYVGRWFPESRGRPSSQTDTRKVSSWRVAIMVALVCGFGMTGQATVSQARNAEVELVAPFVWPESVGDWRRREAEPWPVKFPGARHHSTAEYERDDGATVLMQVSLYTKETQGGELVNETNLPFEPDMWSTKLPTSTVKSASGNTYRQVGVANNASERRVLWYAYRIGGQFEVRSSAAKLKQLPNALLGEPSGAAVVLVADLEVGSDAARALLEDAGSELADGVAAALDRSLGARH